MSNRWVSTRLADVLMPVSRAVTVKPEETYKLLGVRLDGAGPFLRETKVGKQSSASKLYQVETGDFIYSRLFAWRGAFGVIKPDLNGCFVSNEFPTFKPVQDKVDLRFLNSWFRLQSTLEMVEADCTGSTPLTRNRYKESFFLRLEIPLPQLSEQRRIVERLEHLASKIEEARRLREQTSGEIEMILAAEEMKIWPDEALDGAPTLEEITTYLARGKQSKQGKSRHYLVKTRHVQMGDYVPSDMTLVSEAAVKVKPEAVLQDGDVMIASSAAGCLGRVAYYAEDGRTTSTDTHVSVARADQDKILPEYLYAYLKGAQGQIQLRSRERGDWQREKIGFRLTELNIGDLRKVPVPVPSKPEQHRIIEQLDRFQAKVDGLKQLQVQTREELGALLPSVLDKAFRGEL